MTVVAAGRSVRAAHALEASALDRLRAAVLRRRAGLAWLLPVVVVGVTLQAFNMTGAPQRIDDEGTYTAQAWAVARFGELAHYTYWYDHPPVGWLQLAAYGQLSLAFDRYPSALLAMREAMLLLAAVSMVLLWLLARRLGLGRPASTAAVALFALSPLAVQFHRTVYLDNVGMPWLLGALLLASVRRNQMTAFTYSALCFGVAVLSKETFLLALPLVAWVMIRSAHAETRRYTLAVAGSVLGLVGASYVLLAVIKGELLPGSRHVSLASGVWFQLAGRPGSGSLLDPGSPMRRTLGLWLQFDPVLLVFGSLATVAALAVRQLRPYAIMAVALAALAFRPGGYTPVPYVIVLLPLFALVIAGVGERAAQSLSTGWRGRTGWWRRIGATGWLAASLVAAVVAAPLWAHQLRGLALDDLDAPSRAAEQWLVTNVPAGSRLIVDDSMWVDLVRAGFPREDVVWYYKVDSDPAVRAAFPDGWRDAAYVVTTQAIRISPLQGEVRSALANSVVVARFGTGDSRIDVRRVAPEGLAAQRRADRQVTASWSAAGVAVNRNPRVLLPATVAGELAAGRVDPRIPVALATLATSATVRVAALPVAPGETGPRRQMLLAALGARPLTPASAASAEARAALGRSGPGYGPQTLVETPDGLLVTYSVSPAR